MRKIVVSTGNQNKVNEIKNILKDLPFEILSKNEIGLKDIEVVEDGKTLEENSIKKAKALAKEVDYIVIADDSGLFVDALNGQPGVYSSRYGGEEGNDTRNNEKLLEELKGVALEKRTGRFKAVIALIKENKEILTISGQCEGRIIFEEKGNNGFGYDPLFVPNGFDKSFGELDENIKNQISHRAKALLKLKQLLIKIIEDEENENTSSIWYPWTYK